MTYRRVVCVMCDKYYTQREGDTRPDVCQKCEKELGLVKSQLAERTLKLLHEKFK